VYAFSLNRSVLNKTYIFFKDILHYATKVYFFDGSQ
jgi:hypothetical protein